MAWKYREVAIQDDKSVGDSGTETIDLNVKDPITALILRIKVRNDTAAVVNHVPELHVTKIEIVDGGQTFFSLNGRQAVAAAIAELGTWPEYWYDERATISQRIHIPLLFGRHLGDEQYAFDPRKLLNPQLKVTWEDEALYDDDYHTIGVTARVMEGLASPPQCLMWKEIEAWTTASSGEHKVDLPTDFPIRNLIIRGYYSDVVIGSMFTNYKLDCDVGKFIAFDLASSEFLDIIKQYYPPVPQRQFMYGSLNTIRQAWLGEVIAIAGSAANSAHYVYAWNAGWPFFIGKVINNDATVEESAAAQLVLNGWFPHSCLVYPFGRKESPETWFPSSQYGDIALKITEAVASCEGSVAVQQPRTL